ncbi:unnamed protein product, partial [Staurois parvus]
NSASGSNLLSLFSSRSKTDFDQRDALWKEWTFLIFQAERRVKMQAGHRTKH